MTKGHVENLRGRIAELEAEVKRLQAEQEDARKWVMDDRCDHDTQHCGCVPTLRTMVTDARQVADLLAELWQRRPSSIAHSNACAHHQSEGELPCDCGTDEVAAALAKHAKLKGTTE